MHGHIDNKQRLSGREVVIIADEIGEISELEDSVRLEPAGELHHAIWVSERKIQELRDLYPGVPIHGFWQTVLANKLIGLDKELYTYVIGDGQMLFLICKDGRAVHAGRHGTTLALLGSTHNVDPDNREDLPGDILHSALPPEIQAQLPQEWGAKERAAQRRSLLLNVAMVGGVVAAAVAADLSLEARSKALQAEAQRLTQEATAISDEAIALAKHKNPLFPKDAHRNNAVLTRFAEILDRTRFMVMGESRFDAFQFEGKAKQIIPDFSFLVPMTGSSDGSTRFTWSPDGSTTPTAPVAKAGP